MRNIAGNQRGIITVLAALALGAAASAQNINIDYGNMFGAPAAAYGGPAGMPGIWNQPAGLAAFPLVDIAGAATGAVVWSTGAGIGGFNGPPAGNHQCFYDDWLGIGGPGAVQTVTIGPLAMGGFFRVVSGAINTGNPASITQVAVVGSIDPPQLVGGAWPGGHVLGITHAQHFVFVPPGGMIQVQLTTIAGFGRLTGIQIQD